MTDRFELSGNKRKMFVLVPVGRGEGGGSWAAKNYYRL